MLFIGVVSAQFGNLFEQMFRQAGGGGQPAEETVPEGSNWVEQQYFKVNCEDYLCEDTLTCVKSYIDCPCRFPDSQIKCVLPDKKNYVCISKPADDTEKDARDCSFVTKAWKGLI